MLLRGKRSLDMALEQSAKRTGPKRGSSPIQAKDTAKIDNSTFFKAVWRELREEGWTSKPPPRNALDLLYRKSCHPQPSIKTADVTTLQAIRNSAALLKPTQNSKMER
ncbi:hypothetical protein Pcac1_g23358 [Phytophthora cactorum]|nr:hypothetical protein Pcac1_g23358 [Phytophthora cactorum]